MEKANGILMELAQCTGTERYHTNGRHPSAVYTDGIKTMADLCGAYWFIDLVFSYQYGRVAHEWFQIWMLKKQPDETWVATMKTDTNQPPMLTQAIDFSDFPLDHFECYFIDNVMLLKNEY